MKFSRLGKIVQNIVELAVQVCSTIGWIGRLVIFKILYCKQWLVKWCIIHLLGTDYSEKEDSCEKCVSDFAEFRGCECLNDRDCDVLEILTEECFDCKDKAFQSCEQGD